MHVIPPSAFELDSMMTAEERREVEAIAWGNSFGGPVAAFDRLTYIETAVRQRWRMHPRNHLPQPGPDYWRWRCLHCSSDVNQHVHLSEYLYRKVRAWLRNHLL